MATATAPNPNQIKLTNVRLSYPQLFTPKAMEGGEPKYSASFILDDVIHAAEIAAIKKRIAELVKDNKLGTLPVAKICLRPGTEKPDVDGYGEGCHFLTSSNSKKPRVVDRDRTDMSPGDARLFAGCYVNAVCNLWAQNNKFGKRVNASTEAVQYSKPGEPFGAPPVDVNTAFEDLPDDGSDDLM